MAEKVLRSFPMMYEILKYICYGDQAIALLNGLCKTTHGLCFRNLRALIGDLLKKRIITVSHRDQARGLMDKRIAYFKVIFEFGNLFDLNDLKKFVRYFEELDNPSEIGEIISGVEKMKISSYASEKFEVLNEEAFKGIKLLHLQFIRQLNWTYTEFSQFVTIFKRIDPDLFYNIHNKINHFIRIDLENSSGIKLRFPAVSLSQLTNENKTALNLSNDSFIEFVNYLNVYAESSDVCEFFEKGESQISVLLLYCFGRRKKCTQKIDGIEAWVDKYDFEKEAIEKDLGSLLKSNETLGSSLQILNCNGPLNEEFLESLFLKPGLNKLKNLKEFRCNGFENERFIMLMKLFNQDNYKILCTNFEKLINFDIAFALGPITFIHFTYERNEKITIFVKGRVRMFVDGERKKNVEI